MSLAFLKINGGTWGGVTGTLAEQEDLQLVLDSKQDNLGFIPVPNTRQVNGYALSADVTITKDDIGLNNVTNDAQIPKIVGTAKGSLIGFTASGTSAEITVGADNKVLTADSTQASGVAWKDAPGGGGTWGSVTGTLSNQIDLQAALNTKEATANKGAVNGYAGLDAEGKVPASQLPADLPSSADWPAVTSKPEITVGDTSVAGYANFATAIGTLNTSGTSSILVVPPGVHTVNNDLTVNKNITLRVKRGADIQIASTKTLTLNGGFEAGNYKVFTDANVADLTKGVKIAPGYIKAANPLWWGAIPNENSTNAGDVNPVAITKALNVHTGTRAVIPCELPPASFRVNAPIKLSPYCILRGSVGREQYMDSTLYLNSGTNSYIIEGDHVDSPTIENLAIIGGNSSQYAVYLHGYPNHFATLRNININATGQTGSSNYAFYLDQNDLTLADCSIFAGQNGVFLGGSDAGQIKGCKLQGGGWTGRHAIRVGSAWSVKDCYINFFAQGIVGGPVTINGCRLEQCGVCINFCQDVVVFNESYVVPADPGPYTVTLTLPNNSYLVDYGITTTGIAGNFTSGLTRIANSDPGPGEYYVNDIVGGNPAFTNSFTYIFNAAQAGVTLYFQYGYTNDTFPGYPGPSIITNNKFAAGVLGINVGTNDVQITNNWIGQMQSSNKKGKGIWHHGHGGVVSHNIFNTDKNKSDADIVSTTRALDCHDNIGIDAQGITGVVGPIVTGDNSVPFYTSAAEIRNTTPSNLTRIPPAAEGHKLSLAIDGNTTIQKYTVFDNVPANVQANPAVGGLIYTTPDLAAFTDRSVATAFNYFAAIPTNNNAIYFSAAVPFNAIRLNVGTSFAASGVTFNWEFFYDDPSTSWAFKKWLPTKDHLPAVGSPTPSLYWQANTTYVKGDVILDDDPAVPWAYICVTAGTTGDINPLAGGQIPYAAPFTSVNNNMASETATIPGTPYQLTASRAWLDSTLNWVYLTNGGVKQYLSKVSGTPTTGQYKVVGGVYTFAAADAGKQATIGYYYTPADAIVSWHPIYLPGPVVNPDAFTKSGVQEILLTPPPLATCWMNGTGAANVTTGIPNVYPGGPPYVYPFNYWVRCRLSNVTGGSNGGANITDRVQKCHIRLANGATTLAGPAILNLVHRNMSWFQTS